MATLLVYMQALAAALDDGATYLAAAGTSSSVTINGLVNATPNASVNRYDGAWFYHSVTNQQRKGRTAGYIPSSGVVAVAPDWTIPTSGQSIVLTNLFPCDSTGATGEDTSYRTMINRALAKMVAPDEIELDITTAQTYPLTTWRAWLDRPERLTDTREPSIISGGLPVDSGWRGWRAIFNAELPRLEVRVPFPSANGLVTLGVLRPSDTWLATTSIWSERVPGLGLENASDEAMSSVSDVVTAALPEAYMALANRSPGRPNGPWRDVWAAAVQDRRRLKYFDRGAETVQEAAVPEQAAA